MVNAAASMAKKLRHQEFWFDTNMNCVVVGVVGTRVAMLELCQKKSLVVG